MVLRVRTSATRVCFCPSRAFSATSLAYGKPDTNCGRSEDLFSPVVAAKADSDDTQAAAVEQASRNSVYFRQLKRATSDAPHRRPCIQVIKSHVESRVRAGHPYLYDDEFKLQRDATNANSIAALSFSSSIVNVLSTRGDECIGTGIFVPISSSSGSSEPRRRHADLKGCVRIYAQHKVPLDERFFVERIQKCLQRRERLPDRITQYNFYRLCFGEADGLPEIAVDRYGPELVVVSVTESSSDSSAGSAGTGDLILKHLLKAVDVTLKPKCIVLKTQGNALRSRRPSGHDGNKPAVTADRLADTGDRVEIVKGSIDSLRDGLSAVSGSRFSSASASDNSKRGFLTTIYENGASYLAPILKGSRWYFETRRLREIVATELRPGSVLDLFSNAGGFGVLCAARFPSSRNFERAVCVDSSPVVQLCPLAAELNNCGRVYAVQADAVKFMEDAIAHNVNAEYSAKSSDVKGDAIPEFARGVFDCVVVDPPNLGRDKSELVKHVESKYTKLTRLAYLLATKHIVITCVAPQVTTQAFHDAVVRGLEQGYRQARAKNKGLGRIIYEAHAQDMDFPQSVTTPKTSFLKAIIVAFD